MKQTSSQNNIFYIDGLISLFILEVEPCKIQKFVRRPPGNNIYGPSFKMLVDIYLTVKFSLETKTENRECERKLTFSEISKFHPRITIKFLIVGMIIS